MANERILIVEDDAIIALDIQNSLEILGYSAIGVVPSGEEAVQKTADKRPDLVLMDIRLEGRMSGIEAAGRIRTQFDIPIVYLTANADSAALQSAKATEPYGYILKPFEHRELYTVIEMAIHKHRLETKLRQSEQWLATTLKSIGDAVIAADTSGRVTFMNPVAEALTGWMQAEVLGQDLAAIFNAVDEEIRAPAEQLRMFALNKEILPCSIDHTLLVTRHGKEIYLSGSVAPIRDAHGNVAGVVVVFRDITDYKQAEEKIKALNIDLKRRARELVALNKAGQAITYILDRNRVLKVVIDEVRELLDAEGASVLLYDPTRDDLTFAAMSGPGTEKIVGLQMPVTAGIAGWVIRQKQPKLLGEAHRDPNFYNGIDAQTGLTTHSLIAVPLMYQDTVCGVIEAINKSGGEFTERDLEMLETLAGSAATAIENARLFKEAQNTAERLQALSRRLVEVQEIERRHIARELHDEIGQLLTGLKLTLEMCADLPAKASRESLSEAQALVKELMDQVHDLSLDLRPAMLDDLGLLPALLWQFERYNAQTHIRVTCQHGDLDQRFSSEVETTVYRIVQEALTNVARYAQVDEVTVLLWADEDAIHVQVEDRGVGFDPKAVMAEARSSGLMGMYERAVLLGGQLTIESRPGAGTRLKADLPLAVEPAHRRLKT